MNVGAVLQLLVTANTAPADAALGRTQARLKATASTSTAAGSTMKKAFLGVGLAAGGAAAALYKIGEAFDDSYDTIQTRTGATGREMRKLKGVFRDVVSDVPASFDDAATAVGDLNTRLGLSGRPLAKMSKQVTELSRLTGTDVSGNVEAVSKAFVDWEVATKDQSKTLDGFFRLSQKSGMAVSDIAAEVQRFGSPLRQLGFDLDTAAAMFANFERAGVNTSTMVPGLKLALANLNAPIGEAEKQMKAFNITIGNAPKGLQEVFEVLGDDKVKAVDRISLAMATFGRRAGADMKEAIEQGRFEVDKFLKLMKGGEGTILEQGRRTRDLSEQWTLFKNNLKLAVEPVATKFFKGLGDLMKDVTKAFKKEGLQGVIDLLLDKLGDAIPKVAEMGGKLAVAIFKGLTQAPIWTKLAAAAWIVKAMGGFTKLKEMGKGIGTTIGRGIGAGIILGLLLLDDDVQKKVKEVLTRMKETVTGELLDATPSEEFGHQLVEWFDLSGAELEIGKKLVAINTQFGKLVFDPKTQELVRAQGQKFDHLIGETVGQVVTHLKNPSLKDAFGPLGKSAKTNAEVVKNQLGKFRDALDQGSDAAKRHKDKVGSSFRTLADIVAAQIARGADSVDKKMGDAEAKGSGHAKDLRMNVGHFVYTLAGAVGQGFQNIANNTSKALKAMGVKEALNFTVENVAASIAGGAQGKQKGGVIVPGIGTGDKVPAMLEPGEVVLNRKAVAAMGGAGKANAINRMIPRFASGGVIQQALGPYSIPPIQYDPNHAGGNSHLHLDFFDKAQTIAYGKKMQGMGWSIGEYSGPYPGFGGITTQHQSPGHYDGTAFDANTAADETRSEVAAVAKLLGGAGGIAAVAEKIARVLLKGPDGPLKSMGQAALDKVRSAANDYISRKMPIDTGGVSTFGGAASIKNLPKSLAKWNRQYPYDSTESMPYGEIRKLAAWQGLPSWFWKITKGESAGQPGAVGHDPGGTTGYGLYQETDPFANAYVKAVTGGLDYMKMLNPVLNTMAAKLHFQAAPSQVPNTPGFPWYGTQFLAKGGKVKYPPSLITGSPLLGLGMGQASHGHGGPDPGPISYTPTPFAGTSTRPPAQLSKEISDALFWLSANVTTLEEQIANAQTLAGFTTSELGSALGPTEKAQQIALNDQLLAGLTEYASWLQRGIGTPFLDSSVLSDLRSELVNVQGVTGSGGKILSVKQALDELAGTDTSSGPDLAAINALLASQLLTAQQRYNVSQAQYGVFGGMPAVGGFADGGMVAAPTPTVNVNISDTGASWLKNLIRTEVEDVTRKQARGRPLPGARGY